MEQEGYLHRTHGGASKQMRYVFEQTITEKENSKCRREKRVLLLKRWTLLKKMSLSYFHQELQLNLLAQKNLWHTQPYSTHSFP